jgi:cytochrome b involved in lipid metabolism
MHKKSTLVLSFVAVLLIIAIGVGVWVLLNGREVQQAPQSATEQTASYTMDEVARHNTEADCWTVISGNVYDLTQFINRHPGGDEVLRACGTDATTLFASRQTSDGQPVGSGSPHSKAAQEQLAQLKIGILTVD